MIKISAAYLAASKKAESNAVVLLRLTTAKGVHVFSDCYPEAAMVGLGGSYVADGTYDADGSITAGGGSEQILSVGALVSGSGQVGESLGVRADDLLSGLSKSEAKSLTMTLDNSGLDLSQIAAQENLLGATAEVWIGFIELPVSDYIRRWRGVVESYYLSKQTCESNMRAI